eukprot:TRINITY_DN573_c0_g1_i3.p1 TRINITY_DN573_c0_g1~~TRINITY_DN573_c0_g1_i3.p1  ORF type:complete len:376 (+),score=84.45 TRINITY_DN573_c0_g1_i3:99-1130(+)
MEFTGFERMMERLSGGSTDPSAALTISSNSASNTTDVKPPAAEVEDPPRDKRFATILMNGILCYNAEFGESVEKKINTERIQVNGDSKGLYLCLNVSTACEVGVDNMKLALTFTNGDEAKANSVGIFVGYLTASCRYIKTAVYVPFVPDTVTISCQFSEREEDTDEINFTHDVIKYILQSSTLNPGLGSLPSAFTQNHAKHLPQYKSVITKKYNSSWHKYLKANCEVFTVFHFSEEECISKGIWPYVKAHEVRVALASQKNVLEIDRRIARESEVHEHALTEYLKSVLDGLEEGMDQVCLYIKRRKKKKNTVKQKQKSPYRTINCPDHRTFLGGYLCTVSSVC